MQKTVRIVNEQLLETVRRLPCMACASQEPKEARRAVIEDYNCGSDAHHVISKGAGGGDTPDNVMPLCRMHHQLWHSQGRTWMCERYVGVKHWLESAKEVTA